MGVVDYLVVNGVLLSETRGGVESDYIADPLGSTAALMSTAGAITDTFTYWPYGQLRSHVGSSTTPYQYCGTLGYYTDGASGRVYVEARVLSPSATRWLTVDPLWPFELGYAYVGAAPTTFTDQTGLCVASAPCPPGPLQNDCVANFCKHCYENPTEKCMHQCDYIAGGIWDNGNKGHIFSGRPLGRNPIIHFKPGKGGGVYPVRGNKPHEPPFPEDCVSSSNTSLQPGDPPAFNYGVCVNCCKGYSNTASCISACNYASGANIWGTILIFFPNNGQKK